LDTLKEKDDDDWVKRCMTWPVEGIKRGRPKTWWDCVKNDMGKLRPVPKGCAVQE